MRPLPYGDYILVEDDPARAEKFRGAWSVFWRIIRLGGWLAIIYGVGAYTPGMSTLAWVVALLLVARAAWRIVRTPGWQWGLGIIGLHWCILFTLFAVALLTR